MDHATAINYPFVHMKSPNRTHPSFPHYFCYMFIVNLNENQEMTCMRKVTLSIKSSIFGCRNIIIWVYALISKIFPLTGVNDELVAKQMEKDKYPFQC